MYKIAITQYIIQTIMWQVWLANLREKSMWWIDKCKIVLCVPRLMSSVHEERNCFCVWSFWCSELCSVDQTVTVQRGSVLDERVQSDFSSPFAHSGRVQFLETGEGCTTWWGSRAFSAGPIKNVIVWNVFIDYLGIIFICVMSTNCLWLV